MKFVGRRRELKKLHRCLTSEKSEFIVISGRRRTGKSTLIKEFLRRNKKHIKFVFHEGGLKQKSTTFQSLFLSFERAKIETQGIERSLEGIEKLIRKFTKLAKKENKIPVIVFDEFPRTAQAIPGLQEKLQYLWDGFLKEQKVLLIFSGSSIGMVEHIFKNARTPLFGRKTDEIKLKPFNILETAEFFNVSISKGFLIYSLLGGVPSILESFQISRYPNLKEVIACNLFSEESRLLEEPIFFLNEEVSKLGKYWDILRVISSSDLQKGKKHKQILKNLGLSEGYSLSEYLNLLKRLELIVDDRHIGEKEARWKTAEPFLITWFSFVEVEKPLVGLTSPRNLLKIHFKEIRRNTEKMYEFLWRKLLKEAFYSRFREIGVLYRPSEDKETIFEFDIAFTSKDGISAIFECKFLTKSLNRERIVSELEKLKNKVPKKEMAEDALLALICPAGVYTLNGNKLVLISKQGFPVREALADLNEIFQKELFNRDSTEEQIDEELDTFFDKEM